MTTTSLFLSLTSVSMLFYFIKKEKNNNQIKKNSEIDKIRKSDLEKVEDNINENKVVLAMNDFDKTSACNINFNEIEKSIINNESFNNSNFKSSINKYQHFCSS